MLNRKGREGYIANFFVRFSNNNNNKKCVKSVFWLFRENKKIRGETTSPYKFINENHTYITCLFKKKGKRKGKEITRPILSSNSRDAIRRDSSVNEWKINTTIVAVDSSKEKGEEKKRERKGEKSRSIDRGVRSRWNRRGSSPLVRGRQSYFSSAIETLDAAKKGPVTEENFERFEPLLPPPLSQNSNGRCSNTKRSRRWSCNNEEEHPLDPLPITGCGLYLLFLYFSLHHSKFHLRPWRSSHRKIYALAKMLLLYSLSLCP